MGWKGTVRSINAAVNRAERDSRRRQKELERMQKELTKLQALERAANEVAIYENRIECLLSIHKESSDTVNWEKFSTEPAPVKPEYQNTLEAKAEEIWKTYEPNFFIKLLKLNEWRKRKLFSKIAPSKAKDAKNFEKAIKEYEEQFEEWDKCKRIADKVLAGEAAGYFEALKEFDPFSEVSDLGSSVDFKSSGGDQVEATLKVKGEIAVPSEIKSLLSSGKLSVKQMPKARFYEIYQDYVCGCALRVAREVFAVLPVKTVNLHVVENMLNNSTGHLEDQTILSVMVPRATMDSLNIEKIDPSEALKNFIHKMEFGKTTGFAAVERVAPR